jgi:uncharacterized protein (TIGR02145 family)
MANQNITNLADPINNQDAVTKSYVTLSVSLIGDTLFLGANQFVIIPGISAANTPVATTVTDYDGNIYDIVAIGTQTWMASNLKVTHYPNGTVILNVTVNANWNALLDNNTDDAFCYLNNNSSSSYGALYTWAAAMGDNAVSSSTNPSGVQGVCPDGWHLPSDAEWTALMNYLNSEGETEHGTVLKATSTWTGGGNGTDAYDFTSLAGGYRSSTDGAFYDEGNRARFWSTTQSTATNTWAREFRYDLLGVTRTTFPKSTGNSVRCIKD